MMPMSRKNRTPVICDSESFLSNPDNFFYSNQNLKKANLKLQFTREQIEEIAKCQNDMFYFINNYVKIISLKDGLIPMKLWDFQKDLLEVYKNNRFVISMQPRQTSKCVVGSETIKLRNKKTGEEVEMSIEDFHNLHR